MLYCYQDFVNCFTQADMRDLMDDSFDKTFIYEEMQDIKIFLAKDVIFKKLLTFIPGFLERFNVLEHAYQAIHPNHLPIFSPEALELDADHADYAKFLYDSFFSVGESGVSLDDCLAVLSKQKDQKERIAVLLNSLLSSKHRELLWCVKQLKNKTDLSRYDLSRYQVNQQAFNDIDFILQGVAQTCIDFETKFMKKSLSDLQSFYYRVYYSCLLEHDLVEDAIKDKLLSPVLQKLPCPDSVLVGSLRHLYSDREIEKTQEQTLFGLCIEEGYLDSFRCLFAEYNVGHDDREFLTSAICRAINCNNTKILDELLSVFLNKTHADGSEKESISSLSFRNKSILMFLSIVAKSGSREAFSILYKHITQVIEGSDYDIWVTVVSNAVSENKDPKFLNFLLADPSSPIYLSVRNGQCLPKKMPIKVAIKKNNIDAVNQLINAGALLERAGSEQFLDFITDELFGDDFLTISLDILKIFFDCELFSSDHFGRFSNMLPTLERRALNDKNWKKLEFILDVRLQNLRVGWFAFTKLLFTSYSYKIRCVGWSALFDFLSLWKRQSAVLKHLSYKRDIHDCLRKLNTQATSQGQYAHAEEKFRQLINRNNNIDALKRERFYLGCNLLDLVQFYSHKAMNPEIPASDAIGEENVKHIISFLEEKAFDYLLIPKNSTLEHDTFFIEHTRPVLFAEKQEESKKQSDKPRNNQEENNPISVSCRQ
jgi:hypothetical protein